MNKGHRILIIDDEPALRATLAMILERAGYTTTVAADANEAIKIIASKSFDLVFLDLNMKGMKGMQLLPELSRLYPGMPVVILTAEISSACAEEALQLGARGYMLKPLSPYEIISRVADILHEESLARQRRSILGEVRSMLPSLNSARLTKPA